MGNVTSAVVYSPSEGLDALNHGFITMIIVVQSALCIIGGLGNLLTLCAIGLCKNLHTTHNAFILHLAIVDSIINMVLIPINIALLMGSIDRPPNCDVLGAVSLSALVVSILSLMQVAINRYILICKNADVYGKLYNKRNVIISIIAMWIWAILVVAPMFSFGGLGWSEKTHFCFFKNYKFSVYLYINIALCQLGVVWPAIITSVCYVQIIRKLKSSAKKLAPQNQNSLTSTTATSSLTATDSPSVTDQAMLPTDKPVIISRTSQAAQSVTDQLEARRAAKQKAHNRRIFGLIIIFIVFMACWLPIALTFMSDVYQKLPGWVYVLLITIAWINSSVNVFLYAGTNQSYRHVFKCILTCNFQDINSRF